MIASEENSKLASREDVLSPGPHGMKSYGRGSVDHTWNSSLPIVFAPSAVSHARDRTWHPSRPIVFGPSVTRDYDTGRRHYTKASPAQASIKPGAKSTLKALPVKAYNLGRGPPKSSIVPRRREEDPEDVIRRMEAAEAERVRAQEDAKARHLMEERAKRQRKALEEARLVQERERQQQLEEEKAAQALKQEIAKLRNAHSFVSQKLQRVMEEIEGVRFESTPHEEALTEEVRISNGKIHAIHNEVVSIKSILAYQERTRLENLQLSKYTHEERKMQDLVIRKFSGKRERESAAAEAGERYNRERERLWEEESEEEERYRRSELREDYDGYSSVFGQFNRADSSFRRCLELMVECHLEKAESWLCWKEKMVAASSRSNDFSPLRQDVPDLPAKVQGLLQQIEDVRVDSIAFLDQLAELSQLQRLLWQWHVDRNEMLSESGTRTSHGARQLTHARLTERGTSRIVQVWIMAPFTSFHGKTRDDMNEVLDIISWKPENPYGSRAIDVPQEINRLGLSQHFEFGGSRNVGIRKVDVPLKSDKFSTAMALARELLRGSSVIMDIAERLVPSLTLSFHLTRQPAEQYFYLRFDKPFYEFCRKQRLSFLQQGNWIKAIRSGRRKDGWASRPGMAELEAKLRTYNHGHISPIISQLSQISNALYQRLQDPDVKVLFERRGRELALECRKERALERQKLRDPTRHRTKIVDNKKRSAKRIRQKKELKRIESESSQARKRSDSHVLSRKTKAAVCKVLPKMILETASSKHSEGNTKSHQNVAETKAFLRSYRSATSEKNITTSQKRNLPRRRSHVNPQEAEAATLEMRSAGSNPNSQQHNATSTNFPTLNWAETPSENEGQCIEGLMGMLLPLVNPTSTTKLPPVKDEGDKVGPVTRQVTGEKPDVVKKEIAMSSKEIYWQPNFSTPPGEQQGNAKSRDSVKNPTNKEVDIVKGKSGTSSKDVHSQPLNPASTSNISRVGSDSDKEKPISNQSIPKTRDAVTRVISENADVTRKGKGSSKQSTTTFTRFSPTRPLRCPSSQSESVSEDEMAPLKYQIPDEVLRKAMLSSPSSIAAYWSHKMFKGPNGEDVLVQYCRSKATGEKVAQQFATKKALGFDLEWRPNSKSGDGMKANVSLIQLASEERIGLFHLALHKGETVDEIMPPTLRQIIESPQIVKSGVNIRGDATRIKNNFGIEGKGLIELSHLHNLVKHCLTSPEKVTKKLVSLSNQAQEHLQLPLYKGRVRESDWSKELDHQQSSYAATDAYASFRLFEALETKRLALDPVPERPAFAEEEKPIVLPKALKIKSSEYSSAEDSEEDVEFESPNEDELSSSDSEEERRLSQASDSDESTVEQLKQLDLTSLPEEVVPPDEDDSSDYETADEYLPESSGVVVQPYAETNDFIGRLRFSKDAPSTKEPEPEPLWAKPQELLQAEAWVAEWKHHMSSKVPDAYKAKVTSSALRAYAMWHYQILTVEHIAALMREKPLRKSTVSTYILDCILLERLPYDGHRAKLLFDDVPWAVHGRYDSIRRRLP